MTQRQTEVAARRDGGISEGNVGILDRLDRMPDWPARMTAPVAALYMGVSQSTFLARYQQYGRKEGANTFWSRDQLQQLVAEQFDLTPDVVSPAVDNEYDKWKAGGGR